MSPRGKLKLTRNCTRDRKRKSNSHPSVLQQRSDVAAGSIFSNANDLSHWDAPQLWEVSIKDDQLYLKLDGTQYQLTKSGERKFTFGAQNENEMVFVPGKSGKIEFVFSELYAAKRVK